MSDVTKFCAVIVAPIVLAGLAAEQLRQAAERRAERAAEAERRRRARIERHGQDLRAEMVQVIAQLDTFAQSTTGRRVNEELQSIRSNLSALGERALVDEGEITAAAKQLKTLRRHLADAIARAEAAQLAAQVGQQQAALEQLKRQSAADRLLSRRFDPDGLREVEAQMSVVESFLQRQNLTKAQQEMACLQESFARHRAKVEQGQDRWNHLQEEAASAVAAAQERVASLLVDDVVQRWRASDLEALAHRAAQLESRVSAGRFAQVHQECKSVMAEADKLVAAAEEAQRLQDQRDYVARNLTESLADLGFWVQQFPAEEASADATIRATCADGRAITVNVPLKGSLRWTVEGFPWKSSRAAMASRPGPATRRPGKLRRSRRIWKSVAWKQGSCSGKARTPTVPARLPSGCRVLTRAAPNGPAESQHHDRPRAIQHSWRFGTAVARLRTRPREGI